MVYKEATVTKGKLNKKNEVNAMKDYVWEEVMVA